MSSMVEALAQSHGVSIEAVRALQDAVRRGGGRQAQFSHKDLGGMGQWSASGMTQVGDMFNTDLRQKVDALCTALAKESAEPELRAQPTTRGAPQTWWPASLGQPTATGAQNGVRYACFPDKQRVVIEQAGVLTIYDSQNHAITGVSQQQSSTQTLVFTSQMGSIGASDLPVVG